MKPSVSHQRSKRMTDNRKKEPGRLSVEAAFRDLDSFSAIVPLVRRRLVKKEKRASTTRVDGRKKRRT